MAFTFKPAVKQESFLRAAIAGPSGSGKTYTALHLARALANGAPVAVIDTEHGSAAKYSRLVPFDCLELAAPFHPARYVEAIKAAASAGYKVLVIDSLSHAWAGSGGLLEFVDQRTAAAKSSNAFSTGWKEATPVHNALIEAILAAPLHIIATMRSKQEYILEEDSRGKKVSKKVGMAPVQREGMEYEFDLFVEMDMANRLCVQKSRCPELNGAVIMQPTGVELAATLREWLSGEPVPVVEAPPLRLVPAAPPQGAAPSSWNAAWESLRGFVAKLDDRTPISEAGFFKVLESAAATGWSDIAATDAILWGLGLAKWSEVPGKTGRRLVDLFASHPFATCGEMVPHAVEV